MNIAAESSVAPRKRAPALYERIDGSLRERIVSGEWRPGTMLPSEVELAREFGVSQGTVRRAIDALVNENVLVRRQGAGTFVARLTARRSLNLYFNFVGADGARALPESRLLERGTGLATAEQAKLLRLRPRQRVLTFERMRVVGGTPAIVETIVVPEALFPQLGADGTLPNHLFWHYETTYGVSVVRAEETLTAIAADAREASLLGLQRGAPLLSIDRVAFTLDGRAVEFRRSRCNTAHHRYVAQRGG